MNNQEKEQYISGHIEGCKHCLFYRERGNATDVLQCIVSSPDYPKDFLWRFDVMIVEHVIVLWSRYHQKIRLNKDDLSLISIVELRKGYWLLSNPLELRIVTQYLVDTFAGSWGVYSEKTHQFFQVEDLRRWLDERYGKIV